MKGRPFLRLVCLCLMAITLKTPALAQGFAGLGSEADGFALPDPARRFVFPDDHGPHPDFRIEWWYVTANMTDETGDEYGLQWTLFRTALAPGEADGWTSPQLWMGHAAITTPRRHFFTERLARGGIGQAGVTPAPFAAWIDEWRMAGPTINEVNLHAQGPDFAYDVDLIATGPLVAQGEQGYSVKSAGGQASHYYSQPHYALTGTLTLPEGPVDVSGSAWLDREWSSQLLGAEQSGWDWFSLHFEDGTKLMGFALRQDDGDPYRVATWIEADGTPTPYTGALDLTPLRSVRVAGRMVPVEWRVQLRERDLDVTVAAINEQAWMATSVAYWEGPVRVSGSHDGRGYLEMTGYD